MLFAAVKFSVLNMPLALTLFMVQKLVMHIIPVHILGGSTVIQPITPTHKGAAVTLIATMEYSILRSLANKVPTGITTPEFSSRLL